ncbi:MAG: porin family protein [Steroidobacteraceae bacterium]
MMSRTRLTTLSAAVLAAMASTGVLAQDASTGTGFYVGGSLTQSRFDSNNFDVDDIDDEDNSWKAIAGMRVSPHLAFEANYINFGKSTAPSVNAGGPFVADADGFAIYGVGLLPVGPVELFGKAGVSRIDAKGNVGAVFYEDKATQFAYGAGVQLRLNQFALRAEYEKFDTDVIGDLDLISVGFTFTFASNR